MKKKKLAFMLGGIFFCLVLGSVMVRSGVIQARSEIAIDENKYYRVAYVIDGDTFVADIDGREITVRMLGIDTPEMVDPRRLPECYSLEASNEVKGLLGGRSVRLKANPRRELKDKYGRHLLYVYRDDGLFINEDLIKRGFAEEYTFGKAYSYQAEFKSAERRAAKRKIGLWGKCRSQ